MPFLHIRSLPFEQPFDVAAALEGISGDFSAATGIGLEHVTATWEFFLPGHYAVAGRTAPTQPHSSHPVLVDLLAPDFNGPELVATMLTCLAASIAARVHIPVEHIFIHHRQARSGMVFDAGHIVHW